MEFSTKRELLSYLWKNPDDRKLIDRMIARGDVYMEDGMYCLVEKEDIHALRERIAELEKKLEEKSGPDLRVISHAMWEKVLDHGEIMRLKEENVDLRRHLAYVWERCDARQTAIDSMVQSYFNKNRQSMDFDAAKEKLYSIIWFTEDPNEKDERQFAIDQWALLE